MILPTIEFQAKETMDWLEQTAEKLDLLVQEVRRNCEEMEEKLKEV